MQDFRFMTNAEQTQHIGISTVHSLESNEIPPLRAANLLDRFDDPFRMARALVAAVAVEVAAAGAAAEVAAILAATLGPDGRLQIPAAAVPL